MNVSDETLRRAATLVAKAELAQWSDYETYEEPVFSAKFQQRMQDLIENVRIGNVVQDRARLGWQYYSRRGIAAVLLCFLLSCIAMPEAVMAGCRKVIEVVRTVYEEYTEYHITSNSFREVFAPLQFTYIPDSFKEVEREQYPNRIYILYESGELYFSLNQTALKQEKSVQYIMDTEDVSVEKITIQNEEAEFAFRNEIYKFVWIHDNYFITGQSNLPRETIIQILEGITIEE